MSIDTSRTMPLQRWVGRSAPVHPHNGGVGSLPPRPASAPRYGAPMTSWARPPMRVQPPLGPGPAWPAAPVRPRPTSQRTWLLLGAGVVVVVLALGVGLVALVAAGGSSKPREASAHSAAPSAPSAQPSTVAPVPPPAPLLQPEALGSLLLDTASINSIMGTRELVVNPAGTTDKLYNDTTDKPECGGVWANANKFAYAGSGWQAVQTQYLREQDHPRHEVYQSVVSFPTAKAAKDFVATETKRWALCNGTSVTTTTPNTTPQSWWIATVSQQGDMLTSLANREGAQGLGCQHALTARNNVVVDVSTCGWDVTEQSSAIATKIAERISRTL
ncbi:sensor domain-containing protein [Mycobacterium heidelbergense]|uniref:sensor domain-containing protein n=1 Tax=Mycobacterium heidelbergense TaxID=53376 RepID=UPI003CE82421